jgi:hypothetical protein
VGSSPTSWRPLYTVGWHLARTPSQPAACSLIDLSFRGQYASPRGAVEVILLFVLGAHDVSVGIDASLGCADLLRTVSPGLKFTPAGTEEPRERVRLPFELINAGSPTHPRLMVSRSERTREIGPGDELLTYDGVPSAELLEHFQFELNEATPGARMDQLLSFLQSRFAVEQMEGTVVGLTLQHGARVVSAEAIFSRHSSTSAPAGDGVTCPAPPRTFGGSYELLEAGAAVCLYRASREPFASHPIIRHVSFVSSAEARASDHRRVEAFLAATPQVSGVLLDLRDNGGGTAADYVLPWHAPRPSTVDPAAARTHKGRALAG